MKIYLSTLGCKLNESELEAWTRRFAQDGNEIVATPAEAEVCVLNTCAVTHIAARKSRQLARQLARANPAARIVLTGCFADIAPAEARALPNVALLVPSADKDRLAGIAAERLAIGDLKAGIEDWDSLVPSPEVSLPASHLRTRAFVKVQDGCNMRCAYCIIPLARGDSRSRSRAAIVAEVQALVAQGYNEIVLTGVQISAYRASLRDLVAAILAETNTPRLRLTSIAPWDLDETLLDLFHDPRLCRHLHLSLQAGCDAVLRRMRRPYTTAQFAQAVELARAKIPEVGITTDVIVGFPGETETEFAESAAFVERMQFARVHVFPFSPRAGTVAATLPAQVAPAIKEARARTMQVVADASQRAFAQTLIGRVVHVLWETQTAGMWSGYTDNYVRVEAASGNDLRNRFTRARVVRALPEGVLATLENL